jgi:type II secretory pathway component PulC
MPLRVSTAVLLLLLLACGGAGAGTKAASPAAPSTSDSAIAEQEVRELPAPAPAPESASGDEDAQDSALPPLVVTEGEPLKLSVEPPLAPEVNAGVISRTELNQVLSQGIPQFLYSVRTEAHRSNGRFAGWRILSLFRDRPEVQVAVLRPGDTVRRANGQSLERPEAFQAVWNSLRGARELVLDIDRNGRSSKLRYTIAD